MHDEIEISLMISNDLAREGLRRILLSERFEVSGDPGPPAPRTSTGPARTHIVILEVVPSNDIVSACEEAAHTYPGAKLVLLAEDYQIDEVQLAFCHGVDGYILKDIACEPLVASLRLVAMGEKILPSRMAHNLGREPAGTSNCTWQQDAESAGLSEREIEILKCLVVGLANKVISRQLDITEATVKVHVKAVLRKLRVDNRTQAAVWAIKHGFAEQRSAWRELECERLVT